MRKSTEKIAIRYIPILEASSVESDESLQDLWAGLLATASEESDSLSPSFIETLKQLTPAEARTLSEFFALASTTDGYILTGVDSSVSTELNASARLKVEAFERSGIIRRDYDLQPGRAHNFITDFYEAEEKAKTKLNPLFNFVRNSSKDELPELTYQFGFTEYGVRFMKACKGPEGSNASGKVAD